MARAVLSKAELLERIVQRILSELEAVLDQEIAQSDIRCLRACERLSGEGGIQVSFKLGIELRGKRLHGAFLVPLSDALAMAAHLLLLPREVVEHVRRVQAPDETLKEALLELGGFIALAADAALHAVLPVGISVTSEGCQGVRDGVRPSFPYREGDELWVARVVARVADSPPFVACLMIPSLQPRGTGLRRGYHRAA